MSRPHAPRRGNRYCTRAYARHHRIRRTVAVVFSIAVLELELELLAVASRGFPRTRIFLGCLSFDPGGLPRIFPVRYVLGEGMRYSVAGA